MLVCGCKVRGRVPKPAAPRCAETAGMREFADGALALFTSNAPSARVRPTCAPDGPKMRQEWAKCACAPNVCAGARVRPVRQRRTRALLNEPKMRQEVRLLRKGRRGRRPERDGGDLLSAIGRSVRVDASSGLSQRSREPH